MASIGFLMLAALLSLTSCRDNNPPPAKVVGKITEGREVTGNHFILCGRGDATPVKVPVTYTKYVSTNIGDPC